MSHEFGEDEYLSEFIKAESIRNWEKADRSCVEYWLQESGVKLKNCKWSEMDVKLFYNIDLDRRITLKVEIPGTNKDQLFFNLVYQEEINPHAGALLLSRDFYNIPEKDWLREIRTTETGFTFILGSNPKKADGEGDHFYINFQKAYSREDALMPK